MTEAKGGEHRVSRRRAIAVAGGVVVGAALGVLGFNAAGRGDPPLQTPVLTEVPLPEIPEPPVLVPAEAQKPVVSEAALVLVKDYNPEDKARFAATVKDQEAYIRNTKYRGAYADLLSDGREIQTTIVPLIKSVADKAGFKQDSFARKILPGLILIESRGEASPKATSAIGMCQITQQTWDDLKAKDPQAMEGRSITNPEDNIFAALKHIDNLYRVLGDPALTMWAYHIGYGTLWGGVKQDLIDREIVSQPQLNKLLADLPIPQSIGVIQKYSEFLSIPQLERAPALQSVLRKRHTDMQEGLDKEAFEGAMRYVARISAANAILDDIGESKAA